MDDTCAVCAETLEWVAYGSCGHREVCSTCVVRLRFVLDDRRCCICKIESPTVFVTKALGDYTRVITDFSAFSPGTNEGRMGEYWYHEDSQAYFDDVDHYKMIKAMCRLSCSVCENNTDEKGGREAGRRRSSFRSIDQLKGHLFHQHKLFMCSLCLEGRKVFISEQKLYTRAQLNQHISTGDSEVDGSESERGGFKGHPTCEFCKNPFYGDNELYMHMSREHYTCHICQRQHPGHYDYFRNYNDLEIHFRQEHYLCEDEACLAEKFVVFQSESELKRHNTIKHGGHMSRSKRNAALQIPTSFQYRQSGGVQEQRRGRGGRFHSNNPSNHIAAAIQASLETACMNRSNESSSSVPALSGHGERSHVDAVAESLETLNVTLDSGPSSRSEAGVGHSSSRPVLEESSFPALAERMAQPESSSGYAQKVSSSSGLSNLGQESFPPLRDKVQQPESSLGYAQMLGGSGGLSSLRQELFPPLPGVSGNVVQESKKPSNTFADHITKRHSQRKSAHKTPQVSGNHGSDYSTSASQNWPTFQEVSSSNVASSSQSTPAASLGFPLPSSSATSQAVPVRKNRFASPVPVSNPWNLNKTDKMSHSSSAPDLVERGPSIGQQLSRGKLPASIGNTDARLELREDVHSANKSLIEKIRAALEMDEDKFASFKSISGEYRQGLIGTEEYLSFVQQFGLTHLIVELARLCPDARKQRELIDTYNANVLYQNNMAENGIAGVSSKEKNVSGKKKEKSVQSSGTTSSNDTLTDNILNTVKRLQSNIKPDEEAEVLSKDGYRIAKGKMALGGGEEIIASGSASEPYKDGANGNQIVGGSSKQRKKTSKFQRVRLGDGSAAALFNVGQTNVSPDRVDEKASSNDAGGLPVRGVWKNGGGQRLLSSSTRAPR